MERLPLDRSVLDSALERMDIADIAQATIRQSGDIARILENETGTELAFRDSRPNRSASKPNAKPSGRAWRRSTPACPASRN